MAKHWRDQFRDNNAARAAEDEKRLANSEGWEAGADPGENARGGRRSLQLGVRSSAASRPQFVRAGGKAGINIRVGGGVPFEKAPKPGASPPADAAPAAPQPQSAPLTAAAEKPPARGLLGKLAALFGKGEGG